MKVSFLFWKLRSFEAGTRPALERALFRLVSLGVDVFLFAECRSDSLAMTALLNGGVAGPYYHVQSRSQRVAFYSRLTGVVWDDLAPGPLTDRVTPIELRPNAALSLLIVGVHLDSGNHQSVQRRAIWARRAVQDVRQLENDLNHTRTILVGDFNMNPFDGGLVDADALHAVMTRDLALGRHVERPQGLPLFLQSDVEFSGRLAPPGPAGPSHRLPPGTHFYGPSGELATHFWQMYDQILLRPDMMDRLLHLEVMVTDGVAPLVTPSGRPKSQALTDHLPIHFILDL